MVAEIIVNRLAKDLNRIFDYLVPEHMESSIKIGARVFVPFGPKNSQIEGFVIGFKKTSEFANKEIIKIEDFPLTEENVELARIMARRYFCNISECIKLMLPPGEKTTNLENRIKDKTANFVYLKKDEDEIELDIELGKLKNAKHIKVLRFLEENDGIYKADLEGIMEVSSAVIKTLEKNGYVEIIEQKIERNPFKNREIKKGQAFTFNRGTKTSF